MLVPPLVAGCQSNVQHDLVARELRMQEDQIYAMEDYLAQYQQLVCKYRAENAALRRQLGERDEDTLPAPRPSPHARNGTVPTTNGPAIEAPPPKTNGMQPLEVPEVPPLEETTSSDAEMEPESPAADGEAALAAGESAMDRVPVTPAVAFEPAARQEPIHQVWLHGEVVENDTGGGPRLVVEVELLDAAGQAAEFSGRLSLMLLAPNGEGAPQGLARWDFAPEEVQSALDAAADGHIIRFHLELPSDTPVTDSTEIWVRLLPQDGEKLLAHAAIDLREPGLFSSLPQSPSPRRQPEERRLIVDAYDNPTTSSPAIQSDIYDGGWTIARPGDPANLADASEESTGQWRTSSEPMPVAVARRTPLRRKPRDSRPAPPAEPSKSVAADIRKPSGWSPDRPAGASAENRPVAKTPGRPRWSAMR
jgi:hypothetical protein